MSEAQGAAWTGCLSTAGLNLESSLLVLLVQHEQMQTCRYPIISTATTIAAGLKVPQCYRAALSLYVSHSTANQNKGTAVLL